MPKDEVLIGNLLNKDKRKEIAEILLDDSIEDVVIIYRDKNDLIWRSTVRPTQIIGYAFILHRDATENLGAD